MNGLNGKYAALLEATSAEAAELPMLRTCFSVLALASAIERDCARRLQIHGLSEGRFVVLVVLLTATEALAPHDLAERAGVNRATMTGLLDGLERHGLVTRRRDRRDRRSVKISLTRTGRDLAARVHEEHASWIANLAADVTTEERAALQVLLNRIWRRTDAAHLADRHRVVSGEANEDC